MGDPRKRRKKYSKPAHPWMKGRIEEEGELQKTYGFKNKRELWKFSTLLKSFFERAKRYARESSDQSVIEQKQLVEKLKSYNLIPADATLDQILGIQLSDLLERRLQTLVYKKGLANSMSQARQFIVHGHINIGSKKITSPSYLVTLKEEAELSFNGRSALNDENHPERMAKLTAQEQATLEKTKKEAKKEEKKEKKQDKKEEKKEKKQDKKEEKKEEKKED